MSIHRKKQCNTSAKQEPLRLSFQDQYNHPQWQKKRLEIMARDNWQCLKCGSTEKQLSVHHLRYIKGHKVWEYGDEELVTLCDECHEFIHALTGNHNKAVSRLIYASLHDKQINFDVAKSILLLPMIALLFSDEVEFYETILMINQLIDTVEAE